jgi:hypothetical protein
LAATYAAALDAASLTKVAIIADMLFAMFPVINRLVELTLYIGMPDKSHSANLKPYLCPYFLARKFFTHIANHGTFETKRQVAAVTQDRHLENLEALHIWNTVFPFCKAVKIPHFPKPATADGGCGRSHRRAPIAGRHGRKQMPFIEQGFYRDDDQ